MKIIQNLNFDLMALPLGVEPRSSVPETNVLSIELQELRLLSLKKIGVFGQSVKSYSSLLTQLKLLENNYLMHFKFELSHKTPFNSTFSYNLISILENATN